LLLGLPFATYQADALGDIFFYFTDRLVTPYACRNAEPGKMPFMCKDFQKRLQGADQVCVNVNGTSRVQQHGFSVNFVDCAVIFYPFCTLATYKAVFPLFLPQGC
jgi:hypothetical protein